MASISDPSTGRVRTGLVLELVFVSALVLIGAIETGLSIYHIVASWF